MAWKRRAAEWKLGDSCSGLIDDDADNDDNDDDDDDADNDDDDDDDAFLHWTAVLHLLLSSGSFFLWLLFLSTCK